MILKAWGVLEHTPSILSSALCLLRVSHSIIRGVGPNVDIMTVDGLSAVQPAWPVIMHSTSDFNHLKHLKKSHIIAFVFDSRASVMSSNLTVWSPCLDMVAELPNILVQRDKEPFKLEVREYSAMDYIQIASRPSTLSELHSTWCKINPYQLRKEIEAAIVRYLGCDLSFKVLQKKLQSTLRGDELIRLLKTDGCKQLRYGIAEALKKNASVERIADQLGLDSFDISFVLTSLEKIKCRRD